MDALLGAVSLTVSWLFALLTWRQYRARGRLHQAVWTTGLALFALGVTLEVIARWQGAWTDGAYRLWYFAGAMQGVTFLGQGTLHLLDRRPWTRWALDLVIVLAVVSGVVVLNAPLDLARLLHPWEPSGLAFRAIGEAGFASPRAWTIPFNTYGSLWLIGGALVSTVLLWSKQRTRATGTLLIALAGLGLAGTSTLNRFGITGLETLGRAAGIAVLFAGFALTNSRQVGAPVRLHLPRIPVGLALAVAGWALAVLLFFVAFPGAWRAVTYQPGLFLIALILLAFVAGLVVKAQTTTQARRKHQ